MSEELIPPAPITLDDRISNELIKGNVTEAIISTLRERYLPLKINGLEDKETYLLVKEGRKQCKGLRVAAKKICEDGREEATAIQKKWIEKQKDITGRIAEVEDYLEAQEKEYETGIAAEKEARKRKQEEQLILRQQELVSVGALYADGKFSLGEVSFDYAAIKESDQDIWENTIWPLYKEAYEIIEQDRIEQDRLKKEQEAELKRKQEEIEFQKKELEAERTRLKEEADRQRLEADKRLAIMIETRTNQIVSLGFKYNGSVEYHFHEFTILYEDIHNNTSDQWDGLITRASVYVTEKTQQLAEEKRKEQERQELQQKRLSEITPYKSYGGAVELTKLWQFDEDAYQRILQEKIDDYNKKEEEKAKEIADKAAKAERERIEEEQRKAEVNRKYELRKARMSMLVEHDLKYNGDFEVLGEISEDAWIKDFNELKASRDEIIRKQEEERKAEELAQASDKVKWVDILTALNEIHIHEMRSGQYRKKAAILREKLEEIKAL